MRSEANRKINRNLIKAVIISLLITALTIQGLVLYNKSLRENLSASTDVTLAEVLEQQSFNFALELEAEINAVRSLAVAISHMQNDQELILKMVKRTVTDSMFENIAVVNLNGRGIASNGRLIDVSKQDYFQAALTGRTVISEPVASEIDGEAVIPIATPIFADQEIQGILVCAYSKEKLNDILLPSFSGYGYAFIINKAGDIIASTENDYMLSDSNNIFETMEHAEFNDGYTADMVHADVAAAKAGGIHYQLGDALRHAQYKPLGINGWFIFVVVPDEIVAENAGNIMRNAVLLTMIIIAEFAFVLLYIFALQRKSNIQKLAHTKELEQVAYYDEITGLPNLNKFKIDLEKRLLEQPEGPYVLIKFDLVNFKMINEMFDFKTGDAILRMVVQYINKVKALGQLRHGYFARITGDEFILLDVADSLEETEDKRTLFEKEFNDEIAKILGKHKVEFRYGRYFMEPGKQDVDDVIEKVNLAHRLAKTQKYNPICDYNESIKKVVVRQTAIENQMEQALQNEEFKVYLQPKYSLREGKIVGAEALARWKTEDGTVLPPSEFIDLFEKNGFVVKLDMYMLEQVCKMLRSRLDQGLSVVPVSVNFSRLHLDNPGFVQEIEGIARKYDVPRKYLELELTESTIFDNEQVLLEILNGLHELGFTLSMDDFGTGYSSLGLLKNLPVDVIKIDREFFGDSQYMDRSQIVVESVVNMARSLSMITVAEGVESKDHIDFLTNVGCDIVQGYYYSKPVPQEEFSW